MIVKIIGNEKVEIFSEVKSAIFDRAKKSLLVHISDEWEFTIELENLAIVMTDDANVISKFYAAEEALV